MKKQPKRNSLQKFRSLAFSKQGGLCCYCKQPMWVNDPGELTARYAVTARQADLLKCTGEHLIAHSEGGAAAAENIAAACAFCNGTRHRAKAPLNPQSYEMKVRKRLSRGAWHGLRLVRQEDRTGR
jgi:5-methylcytosine-specific restriction endonuclease McrA